MGLVFKEAFLARFAPVTARDWHEVVPGRAAFLSLKGPEGSLDTSVAYLPSGLGNELRQRRLQVARALARRFAARKGPGRNNHAVRQRTWGPRT